jgi:PIN domain nuclease of toxin-antitoxin system
VLPHFLVDTHILLHWRSNPRKLSKEQLRVLRAEEHHGRPFALSAFSLVELALLISEGRLGIKESADDFFAELETRPALQILPITFQIAAHIASVGHQLRDPADCAIVATARVHRLKLLSSDRRIINSKLVSVIE